MENLPSFVLALLVLVFAVVGIFFPEYISPVNYRSIHTLFVGIGILTNINAAILLLLGGLKNTRKLEIPGFVVGLGAWCMLIISSIFGMIWNQSQIEFSKIFNSILGAWAFYNPFNPFADLWIFLQMPTRRYELGVIFSLFHLGFGATCSVLGPIAFGILMKRTEY